MEDSSLHPSVILVKMFLCDLHGGDVDVVQHLDFSDGLQVLDAMLILHDPCVIKVNMEVIVIRVDFDLMGRRWRRKTVLSSSKTLYMYIYIYIYGMIIVRSFLHLKRLIDAKREVGASLFLSPAVCEEGVTDYV